MSIPHSKGMRSVQLLVPALLGSLVLVIALQNTAPVETRILVATITMSAALLLLCVLAIGFVIGLIVAMVVIRTPAASV